MKLVLLLLGSGAARCSLKGMEGLVSEFEFWPSSYQASMPIGDDLRIG